MARLLEGWFQDTEYFDYRSLDCVWCLCSCLALSTILPHSPPLPPIIATMAGLNGCKRGDSLTIFLGHVLQRRGMYLTFCGTMVGGDTSAEMAKKDSQRGCGATLRFMDSKLDRRPALFLALSDRLSFHFKKLLRSPWAHVVSGSSMEAIDSFI
ncbi:hypothetical protein K443DRAFT_9944 [Laccaria amethystina LaAM-08-1]|uniref:Uncharacterized protein n=1 Tax=Laccaria amethystina LaAM-08-1 TaxID=1095629 RepID=A0A0C9XIJ9_9AGAR|nr:hypothetical protein K443DRAFT_9944 [Laccaria amethystina LaAM-08-1]